LLGDGATKTVILQSLGNTEILHIAGHYAVKRGSPLLSSLLLAKTGKEPKDGVLTNAELLREKLSRTKLVVLSACQTGVERYYNGEGFSGLSRTFLAIGAPLVVASQWQVESEATAELMRKFHFYRRQEKLSTTAALRRAQLEMLEASDKRFRHPYFWAAFAVFGGHASF
jgi:CHAT domain-containing protein